MEYRRLGKTGRDVRRVIGFGAWANRRRTGGTVDDADEPCGPSTRPPTPASPSSTRPTSTVTAAPKRPDCAVPAATGGEKPFVATKAGRRLNPHVTEGYTRRKYRACHRPEPQNLGVETHRPGPAPLPADRGLLHARAVRGLDELVAKGDRATTASASRRSRRRSRPSSTRTWRASRSSSTSSASGPPSGSSRRPSAADVGVLARVPLASGLLTGKLTATRVRRGRPPAVQPRRRIVRRRRDIRGPGLRDRPGGRRGAAGPGAGGRHARPDRAALDPHARRDHRRDPRRPYARPGTRQRGRRGARAAPGGHDGAHP